MLCAMYALTGSKLVWGAKITTESKRRGLGKSCFFYGTKITTFGYLGGQNSN